MGYQLCERLLDALADEKIPKRIRYRLVRHYCKAGLLTVMESFELFRTYNLR